MLNVPFSDIVEKLLVSISNSYQEFIDITDKDNLKLVHPDDVIDSKINRHFSWITYFHSMYPHLNEGTLNEEILPLWTETTRFKANLKKKLGDNYAVALMTNDLNHDDKDLVRQAPTRISRLVKTSVKRIFEDSKLLEIIDDEKRNVEKVYLPSPLAVAYDYLTVPDRPESRSYALVALRNLLFEIVGAIPGGLVQSSNFHEFSVDDIEKAYGETITYLKQRWRSSGRDSIPPRVKRNTKADKNSNILRNLLSMNKMLWLVFPSVYELFEFSQRDTVSLTMFPSKEDRNFLQEAQLDTVTLKRFQNKKVRKYLLAAKKKRELYEFYKPSHLEKIPEIGAIVNLLWGVPVPIRGSDIVFSGGLKFASRGGLVMAIHGGPGTGKTSLSLAIGAALSTFGIEVDYFTAEESDAALKRRAKDLISVNMRALAYSRQQDSFEWLNTHNFSLYDNEASDALERLSEDFKAIEDSLEAAYRNSDPDNIPFPCSNIIVLDGLHDLARNSLAVNGNHGTASERIYSFVEQCRRMKALVILTTGTDWEADQSLDYLVDVAVRLEHDSISDNLVKPERRLVLSKARHQLASPGSHRLYLSGEKGLRITPQINYLLDAKSLWSPRLPSQNTYKKVLKTFVYSQFISKLPATNKDSIPSDVTFSYDKDDQYGVKIYPGSNVFIDGEGSGGKAGLALKIAASPAYYSEGDSFIDEPEKILIVSFLYANRYYEALKSRIDKLFAAEYPNDRVEFSINTVHLYPGYLKPDTLFNRIEWELEKAQLTGCPYTSVIIDGIHNVFLQFPDIENHKLFWPQLFSILKNRDVTVITTHTSLAIRKRSDRAKPSKGGIVIEHKSIDDARSDPLRHSLVNRTDFSLRIDPLISDSTHEHNSYVLSVNSAIGQVLPEPQGNDRYLWSRERLSFFSEDFGGFL